jgi:hypothetical protein
VSSDGFGASDIECLGSVMRELLFITQEKSFDLGSAVPCGSLMVVNLWLEIHQVKRIC